MKKLIILLSLISSLNINSQELKIYEGSYEDNFNGYGQGFVKYEYYENENYERIYEGELNYESNYLDEKSVFIKGNFINNKKNGQWVFVLTDKNSKTVNQIDGEYLNNKKNGSWSFNQKRIGNDKAKEISFSLLFANDILIGQIRLKDITGQFNDKGLFVGDWNMQDGNTEYIAKFEEGILIVLVVRKISTGEILSKYNPDLTNRNFQIEKNSSRQIFGLSTEHNEKLKQKLDSETFYKRLSKKINSLTEEVNVSNFLEPINISKINYYYQKQEPSSSSSSLHNDSPNSSSTYYGNGAGLDGDGNYRLGGRKALNKEKIPQDCNESGVIVVKVSVNQNGQVISASPGQKGTTNSATCLTEPARRAALATRFNSDSNAPSVQIGYITYNFKLTE